MSTDSANIQNIKDFGIIPVIKNRSPHYLYIRTLSTLWYPLIEKPGKSSPGF